MDHSTQTGGNPDKRQNCHPVPEFLKHHPIIKTSLYCCSSSLCFSCSGHPGLRHITEPKSSSRPVCVSWSENLQCRQASCPPKSRIGYPCLRASFSFSWFSLSCSLRSHSSSASLSSLSNCSLNHSGHNQGYWYPADPCPCWSSPSGFLYFPVV